jgi:hypothetical protein
MVLNDAEAGRMAGASPAFDWFDGFGRAIVTRRA